MDPPGKRTNLGQAARRATSWVQNDTRCANFAETVPHCPLCSSGTSASSALQAHAPTQEAVGELPIDGAHALRDCMLRTITLRQRECAWPSYTPFQHLATPRTTYSAPPRRCISRGVRLEHNATIVSSCLQCVLGALNEDVSNACERCTRTAIEVKFVGREYRSYMAACLDGFPNNTGFSKVVNLD